MEHPTETAAIPPRHLHPWALASIFVSHSRPQSFSLPVVSGRVVALMLVALAVAVEILVTRRQSFDDARIVQVLIAIGAIAALLMLGLAIRAAVAYWTFRYWIDDGVIGTRGGWLLPWRRVMPVDRVVVIDRTESPWQRLLGVASVSIGAAIPGGSGLEIRLGTLGRAAADELERVLLAHHADGVLTPQASGAKPVLGQLDARRLLASAATSMEISRGAVTLYAIYQLIRQALPASVLDRARSDAESVAREHSLLLDVAGAVVSALVVLWLLTVLHYMVTYARFRLRKDRDVLTLTYGLGWRTRRLVSISGLWGVDMIATPIQDLLGVKKVVARLIRSQSFGSAAIVLHPAMPADGVVSLLGSVLGLESYASREIGSALHRLSRPARLLYVCRRAVILMAVSGVAALLLRRVGVEHWWLGLAPSMLIPFTTLYGWLAWRSAGWRVSQHRWLVVRSGVVRTRATYVRRDRIQSIGWSRSLLASSLGLVALRLEVPTSRGTGKLQTLLEITRLDRDPSVVTLSGLTMDEAIEITESCDLPEAVSPKWLRRAPTLPASS